MGNSPPQPTRTCLASTPLPPPPYRSGSAMDDPLPHVDGLPYFDHEAQIEPVRDSKWVVSLRGHDETLFKAYYAKFCETFAGHFEAYGTPMFTGILGWQIELGMCTELYQRLFPDSFEKWMKMKYLAVPRESGWGKCP